MVFHPPGIVIEIVGTEAGDRGRTCEEHTVNCGVVLEEDVVVLLWKVQVVVDGREETAIAAVWVTDGINRWPRWLPEASHGPSCRALQRGAGAGDPCS